MNHKHYLFTSLSSQGMSEDFRLELSREKRDDTGRENPIKLHNCKLATVLRASANPPDVLKKKEGSK